MVAALGFVIDTLLYKGMVSLGFEPAWARVASLFAAMQATFMVNGVWVFRCLDRTSLWPSWVGYMTTNGFGNFCNYWVFVSLVSMHRPILSEPIFDIAAGGLTAWVINYACLRWLVFRPSADPCVAVEAVGETVIETAAEALAPGRSEAASRSRG